MVRWTERRATPVPRLQTKNKRSVRSDSIDDEGDEIPGAYRISRGRTQDQPFVDEWDPTAQPTEDALATLDENAIAREDDADNNHHDIPDNDEAATSSGSIYLVDDSQTLPNNEDGKVTFKSKSYLEAAEIAEKRWYQSKQMTLIFTLLVLFLVSVVTIVVVNEKKTSMEGDLPLWLGNCELESQVAPAEVVLSPFLQCQYCSGKVQSIGKDVTDAYKHLQGSERFREHVDNSTKITSCDPENVALLWAAQDLLMERTNSDLSLEPAEHTFTRFVLVLLYASLGGETWDNATNWLSNHSECKWHGITCDSDLRVVSLSLPQNKLTGSLDERLGLLSGLRLLNLETNNIAGPIPSKLSSLPFLEELRLGKNSLTGSLLPMSMGNFPNLKRLALESNAGLHGSLESFSEMIQLVELDLSGTSMFGTIPSSIGQLTALRKLIVGQTRMSGTIPNSIGNMKSLAFFHVFETLVTGSIPTTVGNLSNLGKSTTEMNLRIYILFCKRGSQFLLTFNFKEQIYASYSQLEGMIPSEIGRCSKLESIHLDNNQLSGYLPTEIAMCQQLAWFDVSANTFLTGTIPLEFVKLPKLQEIGVYCTLIAGPLPVGLCDMSPTIVVSAQERQFDSPCSCCSSEKVPPGLC